jgi:hypothetical protein
MFYNEEDVLNVHAVLRMFIEGQIRIQLLDELFLQAHQARDQKCRNMTMLTRADEEPDEEPDKEFRDNDMLDHVDFEAGRYDYDNDDDFDHEGIDFQLNQPTGSDT